VGKSNLLMIKSLVLAWSLAQLLLASSALAGTSFYKCQLNGAVQYQQAPCKENDAGRPPLQAYPQGSAQTYAKERALLPTAPGAPFKCDGRKYCSQMSSCAEAQYFLSNCPGVKMDGNNDGTPCEKQWCRP
jgi:Excalibur calcium-binding domain